MYAESNVTSCICQKLGICTLTNPSVGDVLSHCHITHAWIGQCANILYIIHAWIGQCANSKLVTDTGCHLSHHPRLDWSVCKFQACDRYRMSRYSPHTSDTQYAYVQYSLSIIIILLVTPCVMQSPLISMQP